MLILRLVKTKNQQIILNLACEIARLYHDESRYNQHSKAVKGIIGNSSQGNEKFVRAGEFRRILSDPIRQESLATVLMENAGICKYQPSYSIEQLPVVQRYYDTAYGVLYRLICIGKDEQNGPVVLWKGPLGREFELVLLLEDDHFSVLKKISRFFKVHNFCIGLLFYL